MTWRALWMRLRAVMSHARVEGELDEELAFHLEHETPRLIDHGMAPAEARRRARISFGGVQQVKETYRDGRGDRVFADFRSDVRYGLRVLRRHPTLTITVVLTLALGLGANIAIFTAVNAVILRSLPYPAPDRLVALWEDNAVKGWKRQVAAPANMLDWQERVQAFEGVAGYLDDSPAILTGAGDPVSLKTVAVTGAFFGVLRVRPLLGTSFEERNTWQGPQRLAMLSHRTWIERFNADPTIVGRNVALNGADVQVVGVMGPDFAFPSRAVELWTAMGWAPSNRAEVWFRRAHFVHPIARLRNGVRMAEARAQLQAVMQSLQAEYPETNSAMEADLSGLQEFLIGSSRTPLLVLLGATAFLLLIACANVGNLLLVRAASREREVVMRRALGAGRGRIARQALTESGLLACAGGVAGLTLGWWGARVLATLQPAGLLPVDHLQPDLRVAGFVLLVCAVSALLFGTMPALWSAQRPASDALLDGTRGSSAGSRSRAWVHGLAVAEVALAVTLTISAGLLLRSYRALTLVDPGFDRRGVSAISLVLPETRYENGARIAVFYDQLLAAVRALPGVEGAALTTALPLTQAGWTSDFTIRGRGESGVGREVRHRQVSPDYFSTMRVPVLAGRAFGPQDTREGEPVVLINKTLADRYFAGRDPIGEHVAADLVPDSSSVWRRVVGVVGNEHGRALGVTPGMDLIEPIYQDRSNWANLVVRSAAPPATLFRSIERTIVSIDPALAPTATTTMDDVRGRALAMDRFLAILLGAFATVGAMLAVVGVYGVVAQAAQRRVPEMGIRLALGAEVGVVRWLVVRQGLAITLTGVVLGAVAAALLNGVLRDLLFRITPLDPITFGVVAGGVLVTGLLAAWIPARRMADVKALGRLLRNG